VKLKNFKTSMPIVSTVFSIWTQGQIRYIEIVVFYKTITHVKRTRRVVAGRTFSDT
jgi:hypothetical protein